VWHNGRRVLYRPDYVRGFANALREARSDLHDMHFKHVCELDEARAALRDLQAAVQARWEAEARLAELYRERAIRTSTSSRARSGIAIAVRRNINPAEQRRGRRRAY
jgi:hypothetical protein